MKIVYSIFVAFSLISFTACAQVNSEKKETKSTQKKIKKEQIMDTSKLTNETVKSAFNALQAGDKTLWYAYFTKDVVLTDDGNQLNFKSFFDNAFNHKEKFLTIDKVENDGKTIFGNFFAGQWGTFYVFFKFQLNKDGKIDRLDIGQGK